MLGQVDRVTAPIKSGRKVRAPRAGCWVTPRRGDPTEQCHRKYAVLQLKDKGEMAR
jgi:hypothetical protein